MTKEEYDFEETRQRHKWRTRRRFALWSFVMLVVISIVCLVGMFLVGPEQAKVVAEFTAIEITLIGVFASIVSIYIGSATYQQVKLEGKQ